MVLDCVGYIACCIDIAVNSQDEGHLSGGISFHQVGGQVMVRLLIFTVILFETQYLRAGGNNGRHPYFKRFFALSDRSDVLGKLHLNFWDGCNFCWYMYIGYTGW